jgi:hypothetical protein
MPFSNFNPPFTNQKWEDFFNYKCKNQEKALFIQDWIGENFPDLRTKLAYHVPFYWLDKNKIFYLHYFKMGNQLELEISFVKGNLISDKYNLYQSKNIQTKSIWIKNTEEIFIGKLEYYINQAIHLG